MKKKVVIALMVCLCTANVLSVSASSNTNQDKKGIEINSNSTPICDDAANTRDSITPRAVNVTDSYVWYGWQTFAEGRLLCIEGFVTARETHYTRTSMQKVSTGAVYQSAYATGTGKVAANKYNITPPANPESYEGRVHYGSL